MTSKNRFEEIDAFEQEGSDFMDVDFSGLDLNGSSLLGLNLRSASSILASFKKQHFMYQKLLQLFLLNQIFQRLIFLAHSCGMCFLIIRNYRRPISQIAQ